MKEIAFIKTKMRNSPHALFSCLTKDYNVIDLKQHLLLSHSSSGPGIWTPHSWRVCSEPAIKVPAELCLLLERRVLFQNWVAIGIIQFLTVVELRSSISYWLSARDWLSSGRLPAILSLAALSQTTSPHSRLLFSIQEEDSSL